VSLAGLEKEFAAPEATRRVQARSLMIGAAALAVSIAGGTLQGDATQFFRSYLLAFSLWMGITLGCLAILMLQHLTGGRWALLIRRPLEAVSRLLPLMALLFVPLLFVLPKLYEWAVPAAVEHDAVLRHKSAYLNPQWFMARAALYFAVWIVVAFLLNRWSAAQDHEFDPVRVRRTRSLSGPGLVLWGLTVSFAAIDWLMSLDPHWYSSIYGMLIMGGQCLGAIAFMIAMLVLLAKYRPMSELVHADQLHDLGKLMLAFVMIWAYLSFSQFLIIWSANLPEEIPWYLRRMQGGWQYLWLLIIVFHFALPFLLLLSRDLKRAARPLAVLASLVIVMRFFDLLMLIAPNPLPGRENGVGFNWLDIGLTLGIGGIWLAAFFWQLRSRPIVPLREPLLEEMVIHART
jgi:hypothetical protein